MGEIDEPDSLWRMMQYDRAVFERAEVVGIVGVVAMKPGIVSCRTVHFVSEVALELGEQLRSVAGSSQETVSRALVTHACCTSTYYSSQ